MMKRPLLALLLLCLATPAWPQTVTRAEIEGAVITVAAVSREEIVRGGQQMTVELHTTGRVTVRGGSIQSQFESTSVNQTTGRSRSGATGAMTSALDKPGQGAQGSDVLWTFTNGSLVRLRVFTGGAGGQKMTISFRHAANGLACSFSMPMAREVGVGRLHKGSAIDNTPIDILQFRTVSSNCSVSKG